MPPAPCPNVTDAVVFRRVDAYRQDTLALDDVSLSVPKGAIAAVMGPNGAGKSTLFGLISGRLRPTKGRVEVEGEVAEVLQSAAIDEHLPLTVEDVVRQGRYRARGLLRPFNRQDRRLVEDALDAVDMWSHRRKPVHALSGGQRQRVMLAQGIAQQADILVLDEPTTGVDGRTQRRLNSTIRDVAETGATVIFSTHSVDDAVNSDVMVALARRCVCCAPTGEALDIPEVIDLVGSTSPR